MLKQIIDSYFTAFEEKDLQSLHSLYAEDVILDEFGDKIYTGRDDVLAANKELFDTFDEIRVIYRTIGYDKVTDTALCELEIFLVGYDESVVEVHVVDVIDVNVADGYIESIRAYKARIE